MCKKSRREGKRTEQLSEDKLVKLKDSREMQKQWK